jgi:hypothetical protein
LAALTPSSAGAALLVRSLQVSFGDAASIRLPSMAPGVCAFVSEGQAIPVRQFATSGPTMEPRKVACIVEATYEILQSSNAESLLQTMLIESCSRGIDAVVFDDQPGDAVRPAGLRYAIPGLTGTAGGDLAAMTQDIINLATPVAKVAGSGSIVFVCSEAQAVALAVRSPRALPWPVLSSFSLADGTVICVASAAIAAALEAPRIEAARQVTLHEEDTNPAEIVDIGGIMARPTRTDSSAIRVILPVSWALRASGCVAWTSTATW